MNVLQNLVELYDQLPPGSTYKDVAGCILEHLQEAADATIYDVADLTHSSRTTVWRMVQKMGYENYSDFQHALRQAVSHYTYYNRILRADVCSDADSILSAYSLQLKNIRTMMDKHITGAMLDAMADLVYTADEIVFFLPYRTFAIASFQQNLSISGKKTDYLCLVPEMLERSRHLRAQSIVFMDTIDHAEAMDMLDVLSAAKAAGARIIKPIRGRAPYDRYVDQTIFTFDMMENAPTNILLTISYFLMLSEVFRKKFIKETR